MKTSMIKINVIIEMDSDELNNYEWDEEFTYKNISDLHAQIINTIFIRFKRDGIYAIKKLTIIREVKKVVLDNF